MKYKIELTRETKETMNGMIEKVLEKTMNDIVNDIVTNCPVDTGFTRNTVRGEIDGTTIMIHAGGAIEYIEFGTPPHDIVPTTKKALSWKGADHPVKKVRHPGTRPNPIIRSAMHRGLIEYLPNRLKEEFDQTWHA